MSDIKKENNLEKIANYILKQIMLEILMLNLISLALAFRKRLNKMSKTRQLQVPLEVYDTSGKIVVVNKTGEEVIEEENVQGGYKMLAF